MTDSKAFGRDKFDLDFTRIHEIINPADVRESDRVEARVRTKEGSDFFPVRVWKMSPLGIELVHPKSGPTFNKSDSIDLELIVGGQRVSFEGLVVDLVQENDLITLVGIRLKKPEDGQSSPGDRRTAPRWLCSPDYYPTATCPTPGHISDHMYFKIKDISADGMLMTCSLRNKLPVPGLTLSLTANFGVDGTFNTPVEITRVGFASEAGKDRLAVGVQFRKTTARMKSIIGQYLIQFSNDGSLEDLRKQGFWPRSVTSAVNFFFLTKESEYAEVLALRKRAHESDSNLNQDVSVEDMGDMYDGPARIVIGSHLGRIVCTARVRFNTGDEPLEHEDYVDWPDNLPKRNEILEISRLALDPAYRHSDLLQGLFEYIAATCVHDRTYVVISCLERMIPFFEKIGFKDTGLKYDGSLWNQPGYVMMGDAKATMLGRNVKPIYWNLVWRRVSEYMVEAQTINPTGLDSIRLSIYRLLWPIASLLASYRRWRLKRNS